LGLPETSIINNNTEAVMLDTRPSNGFLKTQERIKDIRLARTKMQNIGL
jgi:hypothetical protein